MPASCRPTVAIVDDDAPLRELFSAVLADEYRVHEADSGEAALEAIDAEVDAVLLDRQLGGFSGEEVLERLRRDGIDVPVAMLTAVEPGAEILELDIDAYAVKPIEVAELVELVERLLLRRTYDDVIREYYALASRVAALRASNAPGDHESDERYDRAITRLVAVKRQALETLDEAIESGRLEDLLEESPSTERFFEGLDMRDDPDRSAE